VQDLGAGQLPVANLDDSATGGEEVAPQHLFGGWDPFEQQLGTLQLGALDLPMSELVNRHRRLVRLVESQHRRLRKMRRFIDLTTGQIRPIPDHWPRERIVQVVGWANAHGERIIVDEALVKSVRFTVSAANLILYDDWSPYRRFTVVRSSPSSAMARRAAWSRTWSIRSARSTSGAAPSCRC